MIRIYLFLTLLFSIIFYFITPFKYYSKEAPKIEALWSYSISEGEKPNHQELISMFKIKDYNDNSNKIVFPNNNKALKIENDSLVNVPIFGDNFYLYKKSGKEIISYDKNFNELWSKNFFSYPFSDPAGNLIFLINGDNTQVELIDHNGVAVGVKKITGSFLSSFNFANEVTRGIVCFSSGEVYVINEQGEIIFNKNFEKTLNENFFVKSCNLSSNGILASIHILEHGEDFIYIFEMLKNKKEKLINKIKLPKVYPHLLQMAINKNGIIIVAPEQTYFWVYNSSELKVIPNDCTTSNNCKIYRPVFASDNFLFYGDNKYFVVLDKDGDELFKIEHFFDLSENKNWRFLAPKPKVQNIFKNNLNIKKDIIGLQFQDNLKFFEITY